MNDFEWDCLQKKRIARNIHHMKVSGSPTALTPRPYTNKEIKAMNGPCYTMSFKKPMTWAEFKFLPIGMQKQYIEHMMSRFGIRMANVGYMWGKSSQSMCEANKRKWHIDVCKGGHISKGNLDAFRNWCDAGGDQEEPKEEEKTENGMEDKIVELKPVVQEEQKAPRMNFTIDDTMTFPELGKYLAPLAAMFGKNAKIHVRVVMSNEP